MDQLPDHDEMDDDIKRLSNYIYAVGQAAGFLESIEHKSFFDGDDDDAQAAHAIAETLQNEQEWVIDRLVESIHDD